jgi:hypothetical protein
MITTATNYPLLNHGTPFASSLACRQKPVVDGGRSRDAHTLAERWLR